MSATIAHAMIRITIHHPRTTVYWNYCFSNRDAWNGLRTTKSWIVGFEAISDGVPKNVHHMVLYGFKENDCDNANAQPDTVW